MTDAFTLLLTAALQVFQFGGSGTVNVVSNSQCPTGQTLRNDINYYHGSFYSGECWLSYSKARGATMNYRSVLFTSDGSIMVFNSFEGRGGVYHGSRMFTTFPRDQAPTFEELTDSVRIRTATKGFEWIVDDAKKVVIKSKGAQVTESQDVLLENLGGIEITNHKFLVLDSGWRDHGDPTSDFGRDSTFIDRKGKKCTVSNREVFMRDAEGEHHFRFTDAELKTFLAERCPDLKF